MPKELQLNDISVQIHRKSIKNMYIRIHPDGTVVLSCPNRITEREIRYFLEERYHWIVKHREEALRRMRAQQGGLSAGDCVWLWGRRYPLRMEPDSRRARAVLCGDCIALRGQIEKESDRQQALTALYRAQMNTVLPSLLARAERVTGLHAEQWGVREMHTRWGSCTIQKRSVRFSLNLARFPQQCLYSVIIHELCHFLERGHNPRFYGFMDAFYPEWRQWDAMLKQGTPSADFD